MATTAEDCPPGRAGDADESTPQSDVSPSAKRYRLLQAVFLPSAFMYMGLTGGMVSVTMMDMMAVFSATYEEYSRSLMLRPIGIIVGSVSGGIITDRYRRHTSLFIGSSVLASAASTLAMPWYPNLAFFGFLNTIVGLCQTHINIAGNVHTLGLWGERSPVPVHALHAAYSFGQILGPVVSQPFVHPSDNSTSNASWDSLSSLTVTPGYPLTTNTSYYPGEFVYIPYIIVGGFGCVVSLICFMFVCFPPPLGLLPTDVKPRSVKEIFTFGESAKGNMKFTIFMVVCLFVAYTTYVIPYTSVSTFIFPLTKDSSKGHLHFTKNEAAIFNIVLYACATGGRILGGVLSHCLPIRLVLFLEVSCQLVGFAGQAFLGLRNKMMLWIWVMVASFFWSPIYPALITWADRYIQVTGMVVAAIDTGIGAGAFLAVLIGGLVFHRYGALQLFYFAFACSATFYLIVVVMQVAGAVHGDRFNKVKVTVEEQKEDAVDEQTPLIN